MVFVLDKHKKPLMPCTEKRARLLLKRGRAVVHRRYPFTIRLKDRVGGETQPVRVLLDPGSQTTGITVVRESEPILSDAGEFLRDRTVLYLLELSHRGDQIRAALVRRRAFRRRRRGTLRYRAPRFDNRRRPEGWLPPSLQHRVDTTMSWVARLCRLAPVTALGQELVRFDTQKLQNLEISGMEYQQGTLLGYEIREYLLEKWGRACVYCGAEGVSLQIDHIHPRSRGGSDRVSNLTLACPKCNQAKGNQDVAEFLARKPEILAKIRAHAKKPLGDAAAVNSTRWALFRRLKETGLEVEVGTGGRTKWNRTRMGIPKSHSLDAACVGRVNTLCNWSCPVLGVKATGRGAYSRTRLNRYRFPRGYLSRKKYVHGFQTGDMVKAVASTGKKAGTYVGRLAVRSSGYFNIQTADGTVQGIHYRYCRLLQRADGYAYEHLPKRKEERGVGLRYPSPA